MQRRQLDNLSPLLLLAIEVPGTLSFIFITLKLFGVIDWPLLWVLSPSWIAVCIVTVVVLVKTVIQLKTK